MADVLNESEAQPSQATGMRAEIYDWVEAVVFSVGVIVLIFTFLFRIVGVQGESMMNTLQNGNRVIISSVNYKPERNDIVVLSTKAVPEPIIKRVIATGGQTVDINYETNKVYVDGKAIDQTYIKEPMQKVGSLHLPVTVPKGYVFVMGDNRNDSFDSRFSEIGMVDQRYILGHAVLRLYPLNEFGLLP